LPKPSEFGFDNRRRFLKGREVMVSAAQVSELLLHWEDLRRQGQTVSAEELCRDCPEHLAEVRRQLAALQAMYQVMDTGGTDQLTALPGQPATPPAPYATRATPALPAVVSPAALHDWPAVPGYDILGVLGRGGMGVVYQARQVKADRLVALKMILSGGQAGPGEVSRFRTEAEAVARLQHPNIVQIYEVGEAEGKPFFSLEYVAGGSLDKKINGTPLPAHQAAALAETLARAVEAAHRQGVVHRDLKPANVLLTADGQPKVTDFGLAKRLDRDQGQTPPDAVLGTPSYMAPEQAGGKRQDIGPAADVYALGAILYVMLTGRPPFRGETPLDTVQQVLTEEPVAPALLNAKVPRDLETICLKCLRKEPAKRYGSAAALAEDLRRFQAGEPIVARPVSRLERAVKWVRRNPALAALLAAVALLVAGGTSAGFWYQAEQARQAADQAEREWAAARRQAEVERGVAVALAEATTLEKRARTQTNSPHQWQSTLATARHSVRLAESLLAREGEAADGSWRRRVQALRRQLEADEKDRRLVARLDAIRLKAATLVENRFDTAGADRAYGAAFRKAGLGRVGQDPRVVAARVRASAVRGALVAALDDWAVNLWRPRKRLAWVLAVARLADPDPWRDRARTPRTWGNPRRLTRLAREATAASLPPRFLGVLGMRLHGLRGQAVTLLRAAQGRFPADFWVNFYLANALRRQNRSGEAVGYFRAALALRPDTPAVYNNLGNALADLDQPAEAVQAYRRAIALAPTDARVHHNLGGVLHDQGRRAEAVKEYRRALALNPDLAPAHYGLGNTLIEQDRPAEAIPELRRAIALDPKFAPSYVGLGRALLKQRRAAPASREFRRAMELDPKNVPARVGLGLSLAGQGKWGGAVRAYRRALALDPKNAAAHMGLGFALESQGNLAGAIKEYQRVIALDPKHPKARFSLSLVHMKLGIALAGQGQEARAVPEYRRAVALDPKNALVHYCLGKALYNQGQLGEAEQAYRRAIACDRRYAAAHNNLGLALIDQGKGDEAIKAYRRAIALDPKAPRPHANLGSALEKQGRLREAVREYRRALALVPTEAVALRRLITQQLAVGRQLLALDRKLAAIDKGDAQPAGAAEQLGLAYLCQRCKQRYAAAARFFAAAFAARPQLADDVRTAHRYNAACASALAAAGRGKDAAQLSAKEQARLREQALTWLRADLALWTKQLEQPTPLSRTAVQRTLRHWQKDTDLAGVRAQAALVKLPQAERKQWGKLWADVAALLQKARGQFR
jgi:serine/threonine-protein kinase